MVSLNTQVMWRAAEIGTQRSSGLFRANRERGRMELLRRFRDQAADFLINLTVAPKRPSMDHPSLRIPGAGSAAAVGATDAVVVACERSLPRDFPHSCFSLSKNRRQPVSSTLLLIVILLVQTPSCSFTAESVGALPSRP
jgi:hypothetical protein